MKKIIEFIKLQNREISGIMLFISLFIVVILLFVYLTINSNDVNPQFFNFFIIFALLFFIIDPFIKANLPSRKASLLLLEIYIFFVHFAIIFSEDGANSPFFFLYMIPIISAALAFGIRGSIFTTIIIFILYHLNYDILTLQKLLPTMQNNLPRFISLLIIAIMIGFMSEENRKAELHAYERMSKIVTFNEIKNVLKLDYDINTILKVTTNLIMKIMNCDVSLGLLYNHEQGKVVSKFENGIELEFLSGAAIRLTETAEKISKNDKLITSSKLKRNTELLKLNLSVEQDIFIIIYIGKQKEVTAVFNESDIELLKSLKVYVELLLKNDQLYKKIDSMKDYYYFTFKNLPIGIILLDNESRIIFLNQHALLLLKYEDENEIIGKKIGEDVFIFSDAKVQEKIKTEQNMFFHKTQMIARNLEVRQIELTATKLKTEYGLIKGLILSFSDITEIKALSDELTRREKLASLGQMSAGLAHEIRNPLGAIEGFASLLRKDLEADAASADKFKLSCKILDGVHDLNKIVTEFLNFTNKIQLNMQNRNVIETVDKSLFFLRQQLEENKITLEKNYYARKIVAHYDEDKLKQVLMNLLLNAVDALTQIDSPLITVTIRIKDYSLIQSDSTVCIDIFNNGGNIEEVNQTKIFNPFFTTKNTGIGLGLTISQKIVEEHSGRVYFKNEKNGVKFSIELPIDKRLVYI